MHRRNDKDEINYVFTTAFDCTQFLPTCNNVHKVHVYKLEGMKNMVKILHNIAI